MLLVVRRIHYRFVAVVETRSFTENSEHAVRGIDFERYSTTATAVRRRMLIRIRTILLTTKELGTILVSAN